MKALTLEEVIAAMGGRRLGADAVTSVWGVRIDSREVAPGDLFIAIRGENHDGHRFVAEAIDRGAAAAVISDPSLVDRSAAPDGRLIQVEDTVEALGRLAGWYRTQIAAQVIAVAGSCGKTTVKDLISAVLGVRRRGKAAPASFNNAIGVPLTILSAESGDEYVVVEIGTNHIGEVAALGRIARPTIAVITNIGEEHLEFFGDIDSVAKEEMSLLSCLGDRSFVVINHEARRFASDRLIGDHSCVTYGADDDADLRAVDIAAEADGVRFRLNDRYEYRVPLLGRHNAVNALAAIAVGARFRMTDEDMAAGLATVRQPSMRLQARTIGSVTLINDAYNANPTSMRAAFDVLDHMPTEGRRVLILGDMAELGGQSERCHRAVGRQAGRSRAHVIAAVGAFARILTDGATGAAETSKRIYSFPTVDALMEKIGGLIEPGDTVLLKASRVMALERLVPAIEHVALGSGAGQCA